MAGTDPACADANGNYGLIQCGCGAPVIDATTKRCTNCCEIDDFFGVIMRIYNFLVTMIATPLAVVAISIGAILMMTSAGNPNLMSKGKGIFWMAIIGLVLVFGSYLIINFVLKTIGYAGSWDSL